MEGRAPAILSIVSVFSLSLMSSFALAEATAPDITKTAPAAPGFESREKCWEAIRAGKVKVIRAPEKMPEGVELLKDLEYGRAGDYALKLDLYKPVRLSRPAPALLFIHGGAWKGGNKDVYRPYATRYAAKGYVAACIAYRLSGRAPFPAAVQDAKCAVRWMRANAAKYGLDPNNICVLGGSAGGHLALMVGYCSDDKSLEGDAGHEDFSSRVQAVVDFYGPTDLTIPLVRDVDVVKEFLGKEYDKDPNLYKKASPILHVTPDDPPTLILHGTLDNVVSIKQSDKLVERLKQVGIAHVYDRLEGWPHVMDIAQPVYDRCVFLIDSFLARHMPVPAPAKP
jgi:acetyl esterase/lipase